MNWSPNIKSLTEIVILVDQNTSVNPLLASLELFLVSLEAVAFFLPPVRYLLSFSAFASANRMNKVWWGWSTAVRSISWKNMILLIASFYSLLAEVSHDKRIMIGKRNTSAGLRCVFYHACLSSTTSNVFVTCHITYRTGFCAITIVGRNNFQPAISTWYAHSTLNETGFVAGG